MKKKGFTLIELLAVIIILAIIALITVPIILNIVETSRKESFKDSALSVFSSAELYLFSNEAEIGPEGIDISELKLKNDFQFTSGKIYYENNKIRIDFLSNGVYCVYGYIDYLTIEKRNCIYDEEGPVITINEKFYDKTTGIINESLTRNDWVKSVDISIDVTDEKSNIKEFKYKVVYDDSVDWIVSDTNTLNLTIDTIGKCKLYISTTDFSNNTTEEVYDYNIFSNDNYLIWLDQAGISTNYDSIEDLLSDTSVINSLMTNTTALNYMYNSTGSLLDSIVASDAALTSLTNSKIALQSLKSNSEWVTKYRSNTNFLNKLLATIVLTNIEKYSLGLPFYLFNNGTTGVSNWTSFYYIYFGAAKAHAFTVGTTIYTSLTFQPANCALQRGGTSSPINLTKYTTMNAYANSVSNGFYTGVKFGISSTAPNSENILNHYMALKTGDNSIDISSFPSNYYVTFNVAACEGSTTTYTNTATISKLWLY